MTRSSYFPKKEIGFHAMWSHQDYCLRVRQFEKYKGKDGKVTDTVRFPEEVVSYSDVNPEFIFSNNVPEGYVILDELVEHNFSKWEGSIIVAAPKDLISL
jgi:hypothetical protein